MKSSLAVLFFALIIASFFHSSTSSDSEEKYKKGCKEGKYTTLFGCTSCMSGYYMKIKYNKDTLVKGQCGACFGGCIACTTDKNCSECKEGYAELKQNRTITIGPA